MVSNHRATRLNGFTTALSSVSFSLVSMVGIPFLMPTKLQRVLCAVLMALAQVRVPDNLQDREEQEKKNFPWLSRRSRNMGVI